MRLCVVAAGNKVCGLVSEHAPSHVSCLLLAAPRGATLAPLRYAPGQCGAVSSAFLCEVCP